jgi:hypothetical protein
MDQPPTSRARPPILKMGNEVPSFLSLYSIDPCRLPEGACSKLTLEKLILIINLEGANGYGRRYFHTTGGQSC